MGSPPPNEIPITTNGKLGGMKANQYWAKKILNKIPEKNIFLTMTCSRPREFDADILFYYHHIFGIFILFFFVSFSLVFFVCWARKKKTTGEK